jgi:hypothetical protein
VAFKHIVCSESSKQALIDRIELDWREGRRYSRWSCVYGPARSTGKNSQNSMFFELYTHIADWNHGGNVEAARAECKLNYGVPILRRDDPTMEDFFHKALDHLTHEDQLKAMKFVDVTSEMSVTQGSEYITTILDTYAEAGIMWPPYLLKDKKKLKQRYHDD